MNEKKVEYAREMRTLSPIFTLFRAFISVNIIIRICALQSAHTTHTAHTQTNTNKQQTHSDVLAGEMSEMFAPYYFTFLLISLSRFVNCKEEEEKKPGSDVLFTW